MNRRIKKPSSYGMAVNQFLDLLLDPEDEASAAVIRSLPSDLRTALTFIINRRRARAHTFLISDASVDRGRIQ